VRNPRRAAAAVVAAGGLVVIASSAMASVAGTAASIRAGAPAAAAGPTPQASVPVPPGEVRAGRELFQIACSSCHGVNGEGSPRGPTLRGVGAASAHFYLSTGRMPLDNPGEQTQRKPPAYTRREIRQLVAFVASLGPGPPIPTVDTAAGHLSEGSELYLNNCAPCHSAAGAGGALGSSSYAPRLDEATNTQVAEAVRIGPGAMPLFGHEVLDERQLASLVRYVEYLRDPEDPGGLGLGHLGPIPEGFVGWVVGLGLVVVAIRWIGTRD
jgi:ubiquinol-cytochrome c reductase cytochrome c subunit